MSVDFEQCYENAKERLQRIINSRLFPKKLILMVWKIPIGLTLKGAIRDISYLLIEASITIINIFLDWRISKKKQ